MPRETASEKFKWRLEVPSMRREPQVINSALWRQLQQELTKNKRMQKMLGESRRALRRNQVELRDLSAKLLNAHEEERRRVARELHDDLSQQLAVLEVELGKLEGELPAADPIRPRLRSVQDGLGKLSEAVGNMAYQLHPVTLEYLGLEAALESECAQFSEREGIRVEFSCRSLPDPLPADVSLCLYRVTQESLHNIAKHAKASRARVTLLGLQNGIRFSIEDFGAGFAPKQVEGNRGLGFVSMQERVRLVNGHWSIRSRPGRGTRVEGWVPIFGGQEDEAAAGPVGR